jgi:choline dehydrogenase
VGVEPVVHLAGVGRNLMDHLVGGHIRFTSRTDTLVAAERPAQIVKYLLGRRGLLTSNVGEAHAFIKTQEDRADPDVELIFAPVPFLDHGDTEPPDHGYTIGAILLQPESRGSITLESADPLAPPVIDPAYLSAPEDLRVLTRGLWRALEVFETSPLSDVTGGWIRPDRRPESDADVEDGIRRFAETLYHPAGSCRMGSDDLAVVDDALRVHGVKALRVADASVMPTLNRGHTHAPAVMIGEKAADLIRSGT